MIVNTKKMKTWLKYGHDELLKCYQIFQSFTEISLSWYSINPKSRQNHFRINFLTKIFYKKNFPKKITKSLLHYHVKKSAHIFIANVPKNENKIEATQSLTTNKHTISLEYNKKYFFFEIQFPARIKIGRLTTMCSVFI